MSSDQPQSSAPDIDSHQGSLPRHVAIIMDGNNRWARKRGLPGEDGHRAGEQAVQTIIRQAATRGVEVLTLFAFSSENWRRPPEEVAHLMALFLKALGGRVEELHSKAVSIRFIGDRSAFSEDLQTGMAEAEALKTVPAADFAEILEEAAASHVAGFDDAAAGERLTRADLRQGHRKNLGGGTAAEAAGLAPSVYLREVGVGGGSGGRIERRAGELIYHRLSRIGVRLQALARRKTECGQREEAEELEALVREVVELRSKV